MMVVVYPLTWMVSINKGLRDEADSWYWVGYISLGIGSSFLSSCFIVYSILLLRYIHKPTKSKDPDISTVINKSPQKSDNILQAFHEVDDEWNEIISLDSKFSMNMSGFSDTVMPLTQNLKFDDKYFVQLTKEDKKIIIKLLVMTTFSGVSGLLIIAIGTPFTMTDSLTNPTYTYLGLFFAFFFEYCSCLLVLISFTTQIKIPEKDNIKQMAYMARNIRNCTPEIRISSKFKNISRRLRLYYV